ncbi:unnamed protein product, partial [Allacma fusca]
GPDELSNRGFKEYQGTHPRAE